MDIVEQLRDMADWDANHFGDSSRFELEREAAVEIERLRAENFALAARQCSDPRPDDYGNMQCGRAEAAERARDRLRADARLGQELEAAICMYTHFTGEPPYVGTEGLIRAIKECGRYARQALAEDGDD